MLPADGAFYLYADVSRFTPDSAAFAKAMLKDIGVAATPGVDFDPDRGSIRAISESVMRGPSRPCAKPRARIAAWLKSG